MTLRKSYAVEYFGTYTHLEPKQSLTTQTAHIHNVSFVRAIQPFLVLAHRWSLLRQHFLV